MNIHQTLLATAGARPSGTAPKPDQRVGAVSTGHRLLDRERPLHDRVRAVRDRGQATTEYALILLAAALVGVLVIGWATAGGGAAAIGRLFDAVIDAVIGQI